MDQLSIEEQFELIYGVYKLSCRMHQGQEAFTILCQNNTCTTPQYYFKQIINDVWINKDSLSKICYISPKNFYQKLKSKWQSKQLIPNGHYLSIQKMIRINESLVDVQIELRKTEYNHIEKQLKFKNQELKSQLLKVETKNLQLENLIINIKEEFRTYKEQNSLKEFDFKKTEIQNNELKVYIQILKKQKQKQIQLRQNDIRGLQSELLKQKKVNSDFQREVKTLEVSYKKKLLSVDVANQKLIDNQIQIKHYQAQIKKKGEIIQELTQQVAKITAVMKQQNFKLTQTFKSQKEFYEQKLRKGKNKRKSIIKQSEQRQTQLQNQILKEKQEHQKTKKSLNQQILRLQKKIQNQRKQGITSNSYNEIMNEYKQIEKLINKNLKEAKLQRRNNVFQSLITFFKYLKNQNQKLDRFLRNQQIQNDKLVQKVNLQQKKYADLNAQSKKYKKEMQKRVQSYQAQKDFLNKKIQNKNAQIKIQKDNVKKEMQNKISQLQIKNQALIKETKLLQKKFEQTKIQIKNLITTKEHLQNYIKQLQEFYCKQEADSNRLEKLKKQHQQKQKQNEINTKNEQLKQIKLKQKKNKQSGKNLAKLFYKNKLTIDKNKNWIIQFNLKNNIKTYGGISQLAKFETQKIIAINLYKNNIGDQGWLQLVNLKLDNLKSLKVLYNNLEVLKDIHQISHLQQLLIADFGGQHFSNHLIEQSAILIFNTIWPNLKILSISFQEDIWCRQYKQGQFFSNLNAFPVLTNLYCGDSNFISNQQYQSLINYQSFTNGVIKIIEDFKF